MTEKETKRVHSALRACMDNLGHGDRRFAWFTVDPDTLDVLDRRPVAGGTRYDVWCEGVLRGPLGWGDGDVVEGSVPFEGFVELDGKGRILVDEERVRFGPWRTLFPAAWWAGDAVLLAHRASAHGLLARDAWLETGPGRVWAKVDACVQASSPPAGVGVTRVDPASFRLLGELEIAAGLYEYAFQATVVPAPAATHAGVPGDEPQPRTLEELLVWLTGDHPGHDDDPGPSPRPGAGERQEVTGTIVLDAHMGLTRDVQGRVRVKPFRPLPPGFWPVELRSHLPQEWFAKEAGGSLR